MSSSGAPLPSSFDQDEDFHTESRMQTLTRRLKQEPLVPLGCLLTVFALVGATRAMRRNDHHTANKMFRRRIYAQGFTILALVVGSSYWKGDREKRKEFEEVEREKRRVEKRERWLRELDIRGEEDKMLKEEMERRMERRRQRDEPADLLPKVVDEVKDTSREGSEQEAKGGGVTDAVKGLLGGKKS